MTTFYEKNKDKIHEKITCECGSTFVKTQIKSHNDTKKHHMFLQNSEDKSMKSSQIYENNIQNIMENNM